MSKHEAEARFELPLNPLDHPESLSRVRALVVPVLNEERSTLGAAHVVDGRVDCRERGGLLDHRKVTGATEEQAAKAHLDVGKEELLMTLPTTSSAVAFPHPDE